MHQCQGGTSMSSNDSDGSDSPSRKKVRLLMTADIYDFFSEKATTKRLDRAPGAGAAQSLGHLSPQWSIQLGENGE